MLYEPLAYGVLPGFEFAAGMATARKLSIPHGIIDEPMFASHYVPPSTEDVESLKGDLKLVEKQLGGTVDLNALANRLLARTTHAKTQQSFDNTLFRGMCLPVLKDIVGPTIYKARDLETLMSKALT
ncbi:hypothetical protein HK104_010193 [Borealophlyctis nickersoniae]|nr:hypothetical protein HK104_010193 [Borealophlyctis nickersoniae]